MKKAYNFITESRDPSWHVSCEQVPDQIRDMLKVGCLQRIAESLEGIAKTLVRIESAVDRNPALQAERERKYLEKQQAKLKEETENEERIKTREALAEKVNAIVDPFITEWMQLATGSREINAVQCLCRNTWSHVKWQIIRGEEPALPKTRTEILKLLRTAAVSRRMMQAIFDRQDAAAIQIAADETKGETP